MILLLDKGKIRIIAYSSMIIDHIALAIIWPLYLDACVINGIHMMGNARSPAAMRLYICYNFMRAIGRLSFPLFALSLVEGFSRTRNVWKYFGRLIIFAMLSEVPYDLCMNGQVGLEAQNVLWTLALGVVVLWLINKLMDMQKFYTKVLCVFIVILAMALAFFLRFDGSFGGILLIAVCYFYRKNEKKRLVAGFIAIALLSVGFGPLQLLAIAAFGIYHFYNGTESVKSKKNYYLIYPVHLLVLFLLNQGLHLTDIIGGVW